MEQIDLLIIGAGWHGLAMGKTYLQASPDKNIVIMDSASTIGGVWAAERLYPGLMTNNTCGSYEFSDFPMDLSRYSMKPGQHIPGQVVHQYLVDFATHYDLVRRTRLETTVDSCVLDDDDKWVVQYTTAGEPVAKFVKAAHLVVATGLASEPRIPKFQGRESFEGQVFHAKELKANAKYVEDAKHHVIVVGANKSAWDCCYLAAQRAAPGATVHMVIRPSGRGPSWMWRRRPPVDKLNISRLSSTRIFTLFNPSPLNSPLFQAFQKTWVGRKLCDWFWKDIDNRVLAAAGHTPAKSDVGGKATEEALKPLRPWYSTFWMGNSLSVHNYPTDWFEHVKTGRIVVHHGEIDSLGSGGTVNLTNGDKLEQVDVIVTATGWKTNTLINFESKSIDLDSEETEPEAKGIDKNDLIAEARQTVLRYCPRLAKPPTQKHQAANQEPHRLYRFMVPLNARHLEARNLAYMGFHQSIQTSLVAQAQALWITALFEKKLTRPPGDMESCQRWTYLQTEYQQMRHLGIPHPDLVLDSIPYIDILLNDLGLSASRKSNWWKDLMEQYTPKDYHNLVEEWKSAV